MASSVYSIPYSQMAQNAWEGIMAESAIDQFIIEAGQSRELSEIFNGISEQEVSGLRRFRDRDCRTLKKVIACRIYAKPALELCHMITLAKQLDRRGRFELLFWGVNPVTPVNFRDYLSATLKDKDQFAVAGPDAVSLRYPDGEYVISYGRMPFLTALMDFIVNAIGYESFLSSLDGATEINLSVISSQASALSKSIYSFLDQHLPSVQNQKKFRLITAFLDDRYGENFRDEDINDDDLLNFWKMTSASIDGESSNFISYVSVFDAFVRFAQSLEYGQTLKSFRYMGSIGSDKETEEDPSELMGVLDVIEEGCAPLDSLYEYPMSDVKFLNKREHDALAGILPCKSEIERWPISFLRAEVFGQGQGRITQALRNKITTEQLLTLIQSSTTQTYDERIEDFEKIDTYLQRLLLACFYVVNRVDQDDVDGNIQSVDFATQTNARKAFQGIARKGFDEESLKNNTRVDAFVGASGSIVQLKESLGQVIDKLTRHEVWNETFKQDSLTFSKQFGYIYGEVK